tara:strand:- start:343 stop:1344 length:1002 start_codon:yes stop_codon:yes gene_type:complete
MANYKDIQGKTVKSYTSDPSNSYGAGFEGQLYYNSSDGQFKYQTLGVGAWASGGNLNTAGRNRGGAGTNTAALVFGGLPAPKAITESYDGSSWTEVADLSTARQSFQNGVGTQTAALYVSGYAVTALTVNVEEWDGSSWTEIANVNTARQLGAAGGSTTAAFFASGESPYKDEAEIWNGTAWTEVSEVNTAKAGHAGIGTSTSGQIAGGQNPSGTKIAQVENWDGSSWTETTDHNTARKSIGGNGTSNTSSVVFGGDVDPGKSATTEQWDGSSWTEVADLSTARSDVNSGGTVGGSSAFSSFTGGGGVPGSPGVSNATEEWSTTHTLKKVTTS